MKYKALFILIGILGILITSCESKKSIQPEQSEFLTDSIFSESLSEYRKHNVYLPKGFSREKKYPIIYATDGNSNLTNKKTLLDSLIDNKIIKPLILIASFANGKVADSTSMTLGNGERHNLTYRYFEYVDQEFPEDNKYPHLEKTFKNHLDYFSKELIQYVEKELNQTPTRNDRYFYGVSNGAGFGLSLLNSKPDLIGTYLCFSTFGGNIQSNIWKENVDYPNLYYRYASEETFLQGDAEFLKLKYDELNSFIEIKVFDGKHSNKFWEKEFNEIIIEILKYG
jgi:predicted alpha/beta superfamily hydrolase